MSKGPMNNHSIRNWIGCILGLSLLGAPQVWSAIQQPAGKVTQIKGSASLKRVGLKNAFALRFRDDVFIRDKITTKEQSFVRLLLGGKALVTVRELSVLTITEEADHATIDIKSGIMALSVARDRMKPGEFIEIRTPHAIAAVRGTIAVTEVKGTADIGETKFGMLGGHMDVTDIDHPTRFKQLNENQIVPFSPDGPGETKDMTPEQRVVWEKKANPPDTPNTNTIGVQRAHQNHFQRTVNFAVQLFGEKGKEKDLLLLTDSPSPQAPTTTTNNPSSQIDVPVIPTQDPLKEEERTEVIVVEDEGAPDPPLIIPANQDFSTGSPQIFSMLTMQGGTLSGTDTVTILGDTAAESGTNIISAPFVNQGIVDVQGGTLRLTNTVNNVAGSIQAGNGSVVELDDATIIGGTLQTTGTGVIRTLGSQTATLNGLTNAGSFEGLNTTTTTLIGTITNSGTITMIPFLSQLSDLAISGDVTLTGGGMVMLNSAKARILGTVGTDRLTNANNTIQGTGQIGVDLMALTNQSTIVATTGRLVIDPSASGAINTGTLQAKNGGTLELQDGTFTNTGGIIEALNGSVVELDDATIIGGTLQTPEMGGVIRTPGGQTATLNGLTNAGSFEGLNATTTTLIGTITNSGTITMIPFLSQLSDLAISGDVTLTGGGMVMLNSANARILGTVGTDRLTNANNTIQGTGQIGVDLMALTNQSTIVATTGRLVIDPSASGAINTGTLQAKNGGTLELQDGTFTNTGGIIEALNGSVVELDDATIIGGTLQTTGTGVIRTPGGQTATLNGLTNAGSFEGLNATTTTLIGTITNSGTITMIPFLSQLSDLAISGDVTLTGGGMVMLNSANARILGTVGTDRLTNVNNTIQGTGQIGVNLMALTNQGTIVASTGTVTIDPSATGFRNQGTLRAEVGRTLTVTDSLDPATFSSNTLNEGTYEVLGTMRLANADIVTNAANIVLDGAGSSLLRNDTGTDALANFATNAVGGSFTIQNGRDFTRAINFDNAGDIIVGNGSTFSLTGGGTQTSGVTVQTGGTFTMDGGTQNFNAGATLAGLGTVEIASGTVNFNAGGIYQLDGTTTISGGAVAVTGDLAVLDAAGTTLAPTGTMVSRTGGTFSVTGGLVDATGDGALVSPGANTNPLFSMVGGIQNLATAAGEAMFNLLGVNTTVDGGTGLTVGTDQPIQHAGSLFEASSATVTTNKFLKIDTALLAATAPLVNLMNSTVNATPEGTAGVIDLSFRAMVTDTMPILAMDNSIMNVNSGSFTSLANQTILSLTSDFISLINGSALNINSANGFLVNLSGSSAFNVTGALINFGGTGGNVVQVQNSSFSETINGVPFSFINDATNAQVTVGGTPIQGPGLGAVNLPNGGSLIQIDGPDANVNIQGL